MEEHEHIIPVVEEQLAVGRRKVEAGAVQVEKRVEEHTGTVDFEVFRDAVEVRRVPVNRVVDEPPKVRETEEAVIVPVLEEELIVTRRLVLKEEIHLLKRRISERKSEQVTLKKEVAEVRRLGPDASD